MSGNNGAGRLALQGGLTRRPSRANATGRRSRQDPLSALGALQAEGGNRAVSQLLGRGVPLEPQLREDMEARFGTGFDEVRVHDHPAAHTVAESMHAKAWARGGDIGFGRGRFAPSSSEGRELLAHELAHVVQQRRGGAPPSWERGANNELAADRAAVAAVNGTGPVAVEGASGVGVARAEADQPAAAGDDQLTSMVNKVRRAIVERIVANAGYIGPGTVLVAKANEGVSDQLFQELWREGKGKALLLKFASLGATGVAQAFGGYQIGLVEGLLSPATDAVKGVFGLGVVAESARNLAWGLLKSAYNAGGEIGAEIQQVLDESKALADSASATMKALANDPGTLKWLMSLPEAANQFAQQQAYALGKSGASKVVKALESPWEQKQGDAQPEPELGLSTLASWGYTKAGQWTGAAHDWLIQSPGAKIGESVGYAVGVVAVQVLLLATTAGSASIIEGAGVALAKVASVVAKVSATAGKAVSGAAGMVVMLGGAIRSVEAVMARIGTAFKGAAVSAFEGFVQRSGSWLRALLAMLKKLLGIAEKAENRLPAPTPHATPRLAAPASPANRTSAGPTLVPPDTNGPTLVPDDSFDSDWSPDRPTELKVAPLPAADPDRGPGPGLRVQRASDTYNPEADTDAAIAPNETGNSTFTPKESLDFDSYADEDTELKIAPVAAPDPDRGPGPGLRVQSASDTYNPEADVDANIAPNETGNSTFVPDDSLDFDSYADKDTELRIAPVVETDPNRGPGPGLRQQRASDTYNPEADTDALAPTERSNSTFVPDDSLESDWHPDEVTETNVPPQREHAPSALSQGTSPPSGSSAPPATDSLPPYADRNYPANSQPRRPAEWPSTPEQRARDRAVPMYEGDEGFVDPSPRQTPAAPPQLTPGQQEGVEHTRRGFLDAPPRERPAQEPYTADEAAAAVERIRGQERPHRPSANEPLPPDQEMDAQGANDGLTERERAIQQKKDRLKRLADRWNRRWGLKR
jgi:hypothetical protein